MTLPQSLDVRAERDLFDGKTFLPNRAGDNLVESGLHVARDPGGELYVYINGVYRPGRGWVLGLLKRQLGDDWRGERADAVVRYLTDDAPALTVPALTLVNLTNGLYDIEAQELLPHRPDYRTTVQLPFDYDGNAECPAIMDFLESVLPPDSIVTLLEWAGVLPVPYTDQQALLLLVGDGANGKSVLLELLTRYLGANTVAHTSQHALEKDKFAAARLEGKLANIFPDLSRSFIESNSVLKSLVGQDTTEVERKYKDAYQADVFARHIFSCNEIPRSTDFSYGFKRRFMTLRLPHTFGAPCQECGGEVHPRQGEADLLTRLTTQRELAGLFNAGMRELPRVKANGFTPTASLEAGAQELEDANDPTRLFIEERFDLGDGPQYRVLRNEVYSSWKNYAQDNGYKPMTNRTFYAHMRTRFAESKVEGYVYLNGLRMKALYERQ